MSRISRPPLVGWKSVQKQKKKSKPKKKKNIKTMVYSYEKSRNATQKKNIFRLKAKRKLQIIISNESISKNIMNTIHNHFTTPLFKNMN